MKFAVCCRNATAFFAALLTLSQAVKSPECVRQNMANKNCDEDENGHPRVGDAAGFVCGASNYLIRWIVIIQAELGGEQTKRLRGYLLRARSSCRQNAGCLCASMPRLKTCICLPSRTSSVQLLAKSPYCSNVCAISGPIGFVPKPTLPGIMQQRYRRRERPALRAPSSFLQSRP